jgi:hypothetical protein
MTLAEQIAEWVVTHGLTAGASVTGAWLTARIAAWRDRKKAAARTEEAIAATVERALDREKRLEARIETLESGLVERDATIDVLRDATRDCESRHREAMHRIDEGERRRERWESVLRAAGIDLDGDDSDRWAERLGVLIAGHAAHVREHARRAGTDG